MNIQQVENKIDNLQKNKNDIFIVPFIDSDTYAGIYKQEINIDFEKEHISVDYLEFWARNIALEVLNIMTEECNKVIVFYQFEGELCHVTIKIEI